MGIVVENPGLLTTVQDEGRFGYQQFGVSPAGPMDKFYPLTRMYQKRIFLCIIADRKRCRSDDIPSAWLVKWNQI